MPNFIVDCPQEFTSKHKPVSLMQTISDAAEATGLFNPQDIKVRLRPYAYYLVANQQQDFMHVFGYIREGRTDDQKTMLSRQIVGTLKQLYPEIPVISMNILEFDHVSYVNTRML